VEAFCGVWGVFLFVGIIAEGKVVMHTSSSIGRRRRWRHQHKHKHTFQQKQSRDAAKWDDVRWSFFRGATVN